MENLSKSDVLRKIYYDPSKPGSFSGQKALFREAIKIDPSITLKEVKDWLSGEIVYNLHKPVIRRFKRNHVLAGKPN